ncbi:carbohydrate ABC transporter permease [Neorhizobium galegae]|uniref:carbohydrate ABC transporter permease n=1 Tax=Neorhizobium galegae TaxID=399 RepID=UPI0006228636|nr:carbohydrate ABC transporter permease [Neorhizobium galegae]CDZ28748.1 ABC transporter, permease protein [Neorhizobium galegae bv. officinalis]MCM2496348.1 carbohydrate ABC transporter permease [Neorhizobium galegae]MCQ1770516.1 carbohydrate ABC transporter permease [Neorhizobium galegae]MCQ1777420.1 carbohydrate ABC transporter permease [Neorhizobium galegae]MCQ1798458.1 carbohydrate ABC transporter permease [Neorhizobium galegae]
MTTNSVNYIEPTTEELSEGVRLRRKKRAINFAIDVFLIVVSILMLLPLVFLVANAFKTPAEMLSWPPTIIPRDPTLANFSAVLGETPLLRWIGNSIAFAVMSTIAIVATSAIAGYIFGKFRFRTMNILFALFLATAIVPFEVYMIPLYFQAKSLGILNSVWGLLLGYLVMSFGIFLIRQNVIHSIPDELLEAARIDGAGEFWIFLHIVLPLLRGALGALAVLAFFQAWTAFAWPMIVATTRTSYTIEVGLALFQTGFTVDLGRLSAASATVLIPSILLFVILRRNFVQGVASTGLKE